MSRRISRGGKQTRRSAPMIVTIRSKGTGTKKYYLDKEKMITTRIGEMIPTKRIDNCENYRGSYIYKMKRQVEDNYNNDK